MKNSLAKSYVTKLLKFLITKVMPAHLVDKICKSFSDNINIQFGKAHNKIMLLLNELIKSSYFLDFHLKYIGPIKNELYERDKYIMSYKYYLFREFL